MSNSLRVCTPTMFLHKLITFSLIAYTYAFYEESPFVIDVNVDNFEDEVVNGKSMWIMQFFSPANDACHDYSDEYEKVAKALNGFIKVGAVDVDRARLLAYRHNIVKLPTIIYFYQDNTYAKHKGPKGAQDLVNLAVKLIAKQMNDSLIEKYVDLPFVKSLTMKDIEKQVQVSGRWLVAYIDEASSADEQFKGIFTILAEKLQDKFKFGYHIVDKPDARTDIETVPSIVLNFGKRNTRNEMRYNGSMDDVSEVITWALNNLKKPEILELSDVDSVRDVCVNKKYCVITVVGGSGICDKSCKTQVKNDLSTLAEDYKYYSCGWVLVRKGMMPILEDIFSITASTKFPTMLVVNVQTLKSKEMEKFEVNKAREFLEDVFHGTGFPEYRLPGFDNLLQEHYKPWHDEL